MESTEQKNKILKEIIRDLIWMAVRYAHGRHTYAPHVVRDAMNKFKKLYPNYIFRDVTIKAPEHGLKRMGLRGDYLDDLLDDR